VRLAEVYPENGNVQRIYCDQCKRSTVLSYIDFKEMVEDVHVVINGLPVLQCDACKKHYFPDKSRLAIILKFEDAVKHGKKMVHVNRQKPNENFGFTDVPFIYDSDDYYYIPGLTREHDKGFLTPLFFNSAVLLKFDNSPEYRISFASKTYGDIRKGDDYSVSFGINRSGKVIMWLGDIATLPKNEQYYLRSENINSDHDIGSEFYDGQIECIFTDLSPEDELIKARSEFHEAVFNATSHRFTHLDKETLDIIETLTPPIVETDKDIRHVVDLLNKVNIEALDVATIGALLKKRGIDAGKLGGLKRLQKLLENEHPKANIASLLSPLFVLYDFRVAYSHLTSKETKAEMLLSCCTRLGMTEVPSSFIEIYTSLLNELTRSYNTLTTLWEVSA